MAVRTKVLAVGTGSSVLTTLYTCPTDETAILKSLSLAKLAAGAVSFDVSILRAGTPRVVFRELFPVTSTVVHRELWIVLMPDDQLRVQTDTGSVTVWASGTELEGVAD